MIDPTILKMAEELGQVVDQHMVNASSALAKLPEGETKQKLNGLLKSARAGKIKPEEAQNLLSKIMQDAS